MIFLRLEQLAGRINPDNYRPDASGLRGIMKLVEYLSLRSVAGDAVRRTILGRHDGIVGWPTNRTDNRDPVLKPVLAQRSCAAVLEAAVHEEKTRQKEILTT